MTGTHYESGERVWLSDASDWLSDALDWLSAGPDLLGTVSGREEVVQRMLLIGGTATVWVSEQMNFLVSQCLSFSLNGHVVVFVVVFKHSRNDQSRVFALLFVHQKLI